MVGCAQAAPASAPAGVTLTGAVGQARLLSLGTAPRIDGEADDWPTTDAQSLKGPDGSATFQLAADATHLYAFIRVQDKSPLRNNATQAAENLKGGDAVALYFGGAVGTEQRVLFTLKDRKPEVWVYRPKSAVKQPYTFASPVSQVTFDYVAPLEEAQARFRAAPGGYVLEASLPWKSLGFPARPVALPFELQVIFSDPAGQTNASMAWWHAKGSPGDTVEDLPTEAKLYPDTWGIASIAGAPATLAVAPPVVPGIPISLDLPRAGRVSLLITDDKGFILRELITAERKPAGKQTVEWDGRDRYGAPLPAGKYRWRALLFQGMGTQFMGSVGNSSRPPFRTADGLGSMGGQHGVPTSLAADGGGVYMGSGLEEGQPALRKIRASNGEAIWKRSMGGFGMAYAVAADEGMAALLNRTNRRGVQAVEFVRIDPETGSDLPMGGQKGALARVKLELPQKSNPVGGMAIAGKRAYWSLTEDNKISGVNLENGQLLPDISVPNPLGLVRLDAGNLLVCSGTSVLKLNLANGGTSPVVQGLKAPRAVALDKAGNLYVSDLAEAQQIKKFSATGQPLGVWGQAGGKPHTMVTYDPLAFTNINALSVGPDGNLWVSESSSLPKRFIKLALDGKWLEDFYGPVAYNTFGPDLDDLSTVFYNPGGNQKSTQIIQTKVDYKRYAANPMDPAAAWKIEAIHDLSRGADGKSQNPVMADVADTGYGHYMATTGANGKRYLFRPSKHNRATVPPGAGIWVLENQRWVPCAFLSRDETKEASWSDTNGDGLMQDTERYKGLGTAEFSWLGKDLTLHGQLGTIAAAKLDARGVPSYDGAKLTTYLKPGQFLMNNNLGDSGWTFFSPQVAGAVYYVSNLGPHRHLSAWDRASENRLTKVQDGQVQWLVGTHDPRPQFTEMSTVSGVAGVVDDIVLTHVVEPAIYVAYTTDGYNLGNVIADEDGNRVTVGPTAIHIESFTGLFVKDPASGKKVLFTVSSGDNRILEVTGPGQTTRLNGEVTLDTSRPQPAGAAPVAVIAYEGMYGNIARGQGTDGEDYDWNPASGGLPLTLNGKVLGDLRLRRDGGSLYLLATITDPTPFGAGEAVEIQLAPAAGETSFTLLLSAAPDKDGKLIGKATLNGADVTRGPKTKGSEKADVGAARRWQQLGYRLEARIPLQLLGALSESREQTFRQVKGAELVKTTLNLPDLKGPLRLKAAAIMDVQGNSSRATWPANGEWGTALVP